MFDHYNTKTSRTLQHSCNSMLCMQQQQIWALIPKNSLWCNHTIALIHHGVHSDPAVSQSDPPLASAQQDIFAGYWRISQPMKKWRSSLLAALFAGSLEHQWAANAIDSCTVCTLLWNSHSEPPISKFCIKWNAAFLLRKTFLYTFKTVWEYTIQIGFFSIVRAVLSAAAKPIFSILQGSIVTTRQLRTGSQQNSMTWLKSYNRMAFTQ